MTIETKELVISEELKRKVEMICRFAYVDYSITNGNIKSIKNTNIAYAKPHIVRINNINYLLFDNSDYIFINGYDEKIEFKGYIYALNDFFCINNVHIYNEDIAEVDSKNHVILQCMDIILGTMNFKLNNMDKEKMPGSNRRGKRTISKEKLYKNTLRNIKTIYPNFNIGVSTSNRGDFVNNYGNLQKLPKYIIINMRGGKWKI